MHHQKEFLNKYFYIILSVTTIVGFFLFTSTGYAAWVATDNFESYTIGNNLNTLNGGTGWATAWSVSGGASSATIIATPTGGDGANAAQCDVATAQCSRTFTGTTSGTVSFMVQFNAAISSNADTVLRAGASTRAYCTFDTSGNYRCLNASAAWTNIIVGVTANTWYTIKIKFDTGAGTFQVSANGGAYSAAITMRGVGTDIDTFVLAPDQAGGAGLIVDDIKNGEGGATVAVAGEEYIIKFE